MMRFKKTSLVLVALILVFSLIGCSKDIDDKDKVIIEAPNDDIIVEDDVDLDIEEPLEEDNSMDAIIESSDYISKIKLITKGQSETEIKVLDNIKKELSPQDLPELPDLDENRAYLIFMKDEDNAVVLTDEINGVVLLEGDQHELFEKINKKVNNR